MDYRRAFWVFALFIVLTTVADRILFVILPLYMIGLDFSATEIGLAFTLAAAVLAVFRFLVGKLSDLKGRKGIMSIGLLADSLATSFYPLASTVAQFSVVKGIKEVAYNFSSTMEDAMMGDAFPEKVRTRYLSRLGTVFPLGRALAAVTGFLVVTFLSAVYGFYAAAASLFAASVVFALFYRERKAQRITSYRFSTSNISGPLVIVSLIRFAYSLSFTIAYFPGFFILADSLGLGEADLFLMLLLTYVISAFFAWKTGGWIRKRGKEAMLGISALGSGLFTILYAFAGCFLVFYAALLGVAISFYVFRISYKVSLLSCTDSKHRGEQVGFAKMVVSLGSVAGPLIGGLLIDTFSLSAAFCVAGSAGVLAFLLALLLRRQQMKM